MVEFNVSSTRFDPYKNFKFKIKWDGKYVAGINKISALKRTTEVIEYREGGDVSINRKSPGRTKYEPITLERGISHDLEFEQWANKVLHMDLSSSLNADFKKEIVLELYNESGQLIIIYKIYNCWVSEYQALPDIDANSNAIAIEYIKIENEGWERNH